MVKQQEKTFASNNTESSYSNNMSHTKINPRLEKPIHIPDNLIKNNVPFIPKTNNFLPNFQKNGDLIPNSKIPNGDLLKNNMDVNKLSMNTNNINNRKGSTEVESYSTCDEMSPVKVKNKKQKKTFPKKDKKKKANKSPFKGEAKDFKTKYKTELCKYYESQGFCQYGDKCAYAHGVENLRSKVTNTTAYRTKKCTQFFEQGYCPYGSRCQFAHQLKSNIINNPYDKGMSYGKILETISKLENVENIKKLVEKPRLKVFKEICSDDNQNIKSRLLDDIKGLSYNNLYKRIDN
jgi:hypothetical protein